MGNIICSYIRHILKKLPTFKIGEYSNYLKNNL